MQIAGMLSRGSLTCHCPRGPPIGPSARPMSLPCRHCRSLRRRYRRHIRLFPALLPLRRRRHCLRHRRRCHPRYRQHRRRRRPCNSSIRQLPLQFVALSLLLVGLTLLLLAACKRGPARLCWRGADAAEPAPFVKPAVKNDEDRRGAMRLVNEAETEIECADQEYEEQQGDTSLTKADDEVSI